MHTPLAVLPATNIYVLLGNLFRISKMPETSTTLYHCLSSLNRKCFGTATLHIPEHDCPVFMQRPFNSSISHRS